MMPFTMSKQSLVLSSFFCLFLLAITSLTSIAAAQREYESYTNERFYFSIDYPSALFTPEPAPTNGDGRTFSNEDASLTAWGNLFLEDLYADMEAVFKSATKNHEITYQLLDEDFFVASGFTPEGKVFYTRSDLLNDVVYNFLIEYPKELDYIYDSVTTQVADSYTLPIPSYDCELASTDSEKLICGLDGLSLSDARISKSYNYLRENSPTEFAEQLKLQQQNWLKNRRDACNDFSGETVFVCHSEEMFSRAEYLGVLEHAQKDLLNQLSYYLTEDIPCEEALSMDTDTFLEINGAFATLPYSGLLNHWSYCYGQHTLLKHALTSSEADIRSYVKLRNTLIDLMGAYNLLRQSQAGGGSMYIMLYADAHQWVETEFAYILDTYKANPNTIPEQVLKRASLAVNHTEEDKITALQAAITTLENNLMYTSEFSLDCCAEYLDPYYLEEFKESIEEATTNIRAGIGDVITETEGLDLYLMHEFRALIGATSLAVGIFFANAITMNIKWICEL